MDLRGFMARWVLYCSHCDAEITHSQIYEGVSSIPGPFESVTKPEFPDGGLSLVCTNCKGTSVYLRHQLLYKAS
jgi:hypothetical protein